MPTTSSQAANGVYPNDESQFEEVQLGSKETEMNPHPDASKSVNFKDKLYQGLQKMGAFASKCWAPVPDDLDDLPTESQSSAHARLHPYVASSSKVKMICKAHRAISVLPKEPAEKHDDDSSNLFSMIRYMAAGALFGAYIGLIIGAVATGGSASIAFACACAGIFLGMYVGVMVSKLALNGFFSTKQNRSSESSERVYQSNSSLPALSFTY